jgi:hypothetical protein
VIGLQRALLWQDVQRQNQYAIVDYQTASDSCLELYYPWPDLLRPRVRFLEQQHLAIFSSTALSQHAAVNPSATCQKPYRDFIADVGGRYAEYLVPRAHSMPSRLLLAAVTQPMARLTGSTFDKHRGRAEASRLPHFPGATPPAVRAAGFVYQQS